MKSDCQRIRDHISDRLSGTLPEADERAVRGHLNTCTECRKYAQALTQEDALLTDHFAGIDADRATRQTRVLRALERHSAPRNDALLVERGTIRKISRLGVAAAIVVAAILGVQHFVRSWHTQDAVPPLLVTRRGPSEPSPAEARHQTVSTLELATAISLEKAFRQGGIEAVESQYRKAFGATGKDTEAPSIEELLTDLETEMNHLRSERI